MIYGAVFPLITLIFSEIYKIFTLTDPVEQEQLSLKYMIFLLCIAFINFFSSLTFNYAFAVTGARLTKRLRSKMFESMLRQEIEFHDSDENRSSVLSTRLSISAPYCKGLTSDKLGIMTQGLSGFGFSILIGFYLSWKLCLVMLLFTPISFFGGLLIGQTSTNVKVKGKFSVEEGGRLVIETVDNIRTVVSLGREVYFLEEFKNIFSLKFKKALAILHLQAFFYALSNSLLYFVQAAAFGFGFYLIKTDGLTVSNMFRVYASLTFSSQVLGRVYSQLPDQKKSLDAAKTAFKIIDRKSKIDSLSEEGLRPEKVIGDVKFENVNFSYPNRPNNKVLDGFNLFIKNGQTTALVGSSGQFF